MPRRDDKLAEIARQKVRLEELERERAVAAERIAALEYRSSRRRGSAVIGFRFPGSGCPLLENIHPVDEAAPGDLAPGGTFPFLGQETWVRAEGRFDPCCAPDAQRRSLADFGNVADGVLFEIWNGREYRELVKTYRTRALCIGCNVGRPAEVR
jgi:hypothetical protein